MDWMYYLLEANLYLLLFYGFYKLFLQHETFYNINRYFVLVSSLTAFVLPILQLGFLKPAPVVDNALFPPPVLYTVDELANLASNPVVEHTNYMDYLYPIYLLIAFIFAAKLILSLIKIIRLWAKANKKSNGKITIIELDGQTTAFSFFNLLFIHPHLAEKETVFKHELVHIKQKHSLDILFFEILQIVCWFNPIIFFIKKDIKLLHEYIADDLSTNQGMKKHEYAMFLIENSFGVLPTPLTNQIFNQSILKRRINMLNKKRTANWARLRLLLALPLAGGMLCVSTMAFTKSYGYVDLLPEKSNATVTVQQEVLEIKKTYFPAHEYDEKNNYISLEKRLIVINGNQIVDNNKYYGTNEADDVIYLNSTEAIKKYGTIKGKYGAVEIFGEKAVNTFPPPIVKPTQEKLKDPPAIEAPPTGYNVKKDQVKFPPPIVKPDHINFYPKHVYSVKSNEMIKVDNRYIVINGNAIKDNSKFYGLRNAESITIINPEKAMKKYGKIAQFGAVQIIGNKIKILGPKSVVSPPPIERPVKFPPPIVRPVKSDMPRVTKVVRGYPLSSDADEIKEVKIQAYPQKSDLTRVVQGYPIKSNKDEIKEVKIVGYGQQSHQDIVVQGFPINSNGDQLNKVKIQANPQKPTVTGAVKGHPINENKIKEVKVQGYPSNQIKTKSNEPSDLDEQKLENSPYQTKLTGIPSPQSLTQKPIARSLRGNANTHRYVSASKTVYL